VNDKSAEEEWAYIGKWSVEEPTVLSGIKGDKGLGKLIMNIRRVGIKLITASVVKDVAAHHAISAKFDKPIDNSGKTLVVQYEVKLQSTVSPTNRALFADPLFRWPRLRWCIP
jgi:calnexin